MNKQLKINDFLIILCIYIAAAAFPFNLFTDNEILINILTGLTRLGVFIGLAIYIVKNKIAETDDSNYKLVAVMLPFYLVCFTNLYYQFYKNSISFDFDIWLLITKLFVSFTTAFAEDLVFRTAAFNLLSKKKPLERIFIAALIFGAAHFVNFFSNFNPAVFIQMIYTFLIGILIGLLYEYGKSLYPCALFHFIYNGVNENFYELSYKGGNDISFYICAIIVGVVVAIYAILIYMFVLRKYNNPLIEEKK